MLSRTIKSATDLFLTLLNNSQSYLIWCASLKASVTIQRAAQNAGQIYPKMPCKLVKTCFRAYN